MYTPHVITQELTKWHIQLMHILSDIAFLIPASLNFYDLFLHVMGPNFG
jgi:hypothetical protein